MPTMPSGTDERSQKRTSGVHRKGRAWVYCDSRRKPWLQQGKITPSDETASGETIGFYYQRARYMNPASGRFTQQDSFAGFDSDPLSLHKYNYANSAPTIYVDPSGNISSLVEIAIGIDLNGLTKAANTQIARQQFRRMLFGNPPKDFGIVGEWIIDYAVNAVAGTLIELDGGKPKQPGFGTDAHLRLEDGLEKDFNRFKKRAEKKDLCLLVLRLDLKSLRCRTVHLVRDVEKDRWGLTSSFFTREIPLLHLI